jgi:carboxylate-amine ligase
MLEFTRSTPLTLGVELELMIVNRRDYNLTRGSDDLLLLINRQPHGYDIKPEITQGMIEIGTAIHTHCSEMLQELQAIRQLLTRNAEKLNLAWLAAAPTHSSTGATSRFTPRPAISWFRTVWLSGQAIHRIRATHPHWLPGRGQRHPAGALPGALHSPFHRAVGRLTVLSGHGHPVPDSRLTSVNAFPCPAACPAWKTGTSSMTTFRTWPDWALSPA